jgi:hypothetical protein
MQGWTLLTSVMPGLVVRSWSGLRCGVPICGALIFAWQSSTAQICLMPIWMVQKGLTQGQLNRAHCNSGTKLPTGLTGVEDAKR